jgi:drug/metabolite transporter (DMT)-like permease
MATVDVQPTGATGPTPSPASGLAASKVRAGILCMIAATVAFAAMYALSKRLVAEYPVGQIMFTRSLVGFVICASMMLPIYGRSVFATKRAGAHWMRGFSQSASQTFALLAFQLMPLAGAVAINFSAPLWAALIAIVWLRERAGLGRSTTLLAGFSGVLIVTDPGLNSFTLGAIFALINAIMVGSVTVAVRGMTRTESVNTLLIWQLATVSIFHSTLLVFGLKWPTIYGLVLLVMCGVANLIAQFFWTTALMLAPTTAVSPFFYFTLVWTAVIGFLVWGEVPTTNLLIGASVVVASGLWLLWRETHNNDR